jgi:hypothetical protein
MNFCFRVCLFLEMELINNTGRNEKKISILKSSLMILGKPWQVRHVTLELLLGDVIFRFTVSSIVTCQT